MQHQTKVRKATILDLLPVAMLADKYSKEVQTMDNHPLCVETLMQNMAATLLSEDGYLNLLEVDGRIVGGLWGILTTQPWSSTKFAQDVIIFVDADYRNGCGLLLIRDWIKWAENKGAKEVYLSTASGVDTERFIRLAGKLGFEPVGHGFKKEV